MTIKQTLTILCLCICLSAEAQVCVSPNGKLSLEQNAGTFTLHCQKQPVLEISQVGLTTTLRGNGITLKGVSDNGQVNADYTMLSGKRRHCTNAANEYTFHYVDSNGKPLHMIVRLYNDGLAFRYLLPHIGQERLTGEHTTYRIPEGTRRWVQKWVDSYEGFFPLTTSGAKHPEGNANRHWGYPMLIEPTDGMFALITEAGIERMHGASSLRNDTDPELYKVTPDTTGTTPLQYCSSSDSDYLSPWRVVIVGTLQDVVASTLVTDVSEPSRIADTDWIKPGVVSWIYWAHNHGSNDYGIICQYVDMAVQLRLPYVLIDAEWDEMKDGKSIEDAIRYAKDRGIKPLIWYNSSVGWVNGAPTPLFRLNKPEDREREFAWCDSLGVAGVKIDFFSGDSQMNMEYCIDLLECAARHHLLVNFHGATLPRGWQRTYPNLMSTEAVYGAEWYNNAPTLTTRAASHNATLPFTRNVVGSMDYTPCTFSDSQHPHITSSAHELALTVLFESALQHLADRPESYLSQPQPVQDFFGTLPTVWDETRLVSGYPGEYAVLARRSGTTWYVAGVNGTDTNKSIPLPIKDFISSKKHTTFFADSEDKSQPWSVTHPKMKQIPDSIQCQPRGGFVLIIPNSSR